MLQQKVKTPNKETFTLIYAAAVLSLKWRGRTPTIIIKRTIQTSTEVGVNGVSTIEYLHAKIQIGLPDTSGKPTI
jgi:hypothetical protein